MLTLFCHLRERYIDMEANPSGGGLRCGSTADRLQELRGSNPAEDMDVCVIECRVIRVEVSASGRSLTQSSLIECCVIEFGRMQQ
jgi:hypothetical protein